MKMKFREQPVTVSWRYFAIYLIISLAVEGTAFSVSRLPSIDEGAAMVTFICFLPLSALLALFALFIGIMISLQNRRYSQSLLVVLAVAGSYIGIFAIFAF
ncbi:hypothetical protein [Paenibacillus lutrae]|uniref:Uncharacterized protein n=1 Tax=Paenibacillus lutrae TaxID=2078573 RepID=A0A7X3FJU8_9BACL|nr:hypothetical protein [Paenibacillus lutrae]MVP00814.1 hypothetical protein [Paenibacillus lutrae]